MRGGHDPWLSRSIDDALLRLDRFVFGKCLRRGFRAALLSHRDSARLCAVAKPPDHSDAAADRLPAPLISAGLDRHTALSYQVSVISLTLGWAIYQQSNALHRHLVDTIGFDESYATGLAAMVTGFPDPVRTATAAE